jgi:hypothetical protein
MLLLLCADRAMAAESTQWRVLQIELTAKAHHDDPLDGVQVSAQFTGPGGTMRIPAFWAGGDRWIIRFAPTVPGDWSYETTCNRQDDAGLHGVKGRIMVAEAAKAGTPNENALYRHGGFLKVSGDQRYLTFADGTPFFWLGDTWWFCPSDLMPMDRSNRPGIASMYKHLIDVRAGQGYSAIHMAFLNSGGGTGTFTELFEKKFNAAYWDMVDRYIQYANEKGIVPVIGLGFHHGLDAPTLPQLQRLWGYFVARYGAYAVTWLISGEYNLDTGKDELRKQKDADRVKKVLALGQFLKNSDPYHRAMTVHPWYFISDKRQAWDAPWYDFIMLQGSHILEGPPPKFYREIYARANPKPLLEGECTYEHIGNFDAAVVRHNAYKAIQCGSCGFTYGAHGLWYPTQDEKDTKFSEWGKPVPWWEAIAFEGGAQMKHLRAVYESVEWWKLRPVETDKALELDHKPKSAWQEITIKADEQRVYVIYIPDKQEAGLRMRFTGDDAGRKYQVTIVDPRTGERRDGGTIQGERALLPALVREKDWVIILRQVTRACPDFREEA